MDSYKIVREDESLLYTTTHEDTLESAGSFHYAVHVLIELPNDEFVLKAVFSKYSHKFEKFISPCFGHIRSDEVYLYGGIRLLKKQLGLDANPANMTHRGKTTFKPPVSNITGIRTASEIIGLYSYLLDPSKESLYPLEENTTLVTRPFKDVLVQFDNNKELYDPIMKTLIALYLG